MPCRVVYNAAAALRQYHLIGEEMADDRTTVIKNRGEQRRVLPARRGSPCHNFVL